VPDHIVDGFLTNPKQLLLNVRRTPMGGADDSGFEGERRTLDRLLTGTLKGLGDTAPLEQWRTKVLRGFRKAPKLPALELLAQHLRLQPNSTRSDVR
jgi:hypothetical protein